MRKKSSHFNPPDIRSAVGQSARIHLATITARHGVDPRQQRGARSSSQPENCLVLPHQAAFFIRLSQLPVFRSRDVPDVKLHPPPFPTVLWKLVGNNSRLIRREMNALDYRR